MAWQLGDQTSSEQLIKDLYIDLRNRVVAWSHITEQTPQARMGYVGQHLVSIVTGIPGGKSGARGFDLVLPNGQQSEIKTCYRVDQLGKCANCRAVVSSIETSCHKCGSKKVIRKDDSKWLIGVKTQLDFQQVLDPINYYLVLFEFEEISDASNQNIIAYIWSIDPRNIGFAACMVDYKLNIQSKSKSGAPFNLWPWSPKFYMMKPKLVYKSVISPAGVDTKFFHGTPGDPVPVVESFPDFTTFRRATTFNLNNLSAFVASSGPGLSPASTILGVKKQVSEIQKQIGNEEFCDRLAKSVYRPLLAGKSAEVPAVLLQKSPDLKALLS